jgi:hypothetical protein
MNRNNPTCYYCRGEHYADECQQFKTAEERCRKITENKSCIKCLRKDHTVNHCPKTDNRCFHCSERDHHRSICQKKFGEIQAGHFQKMENSNPKLAAQIATEVAKALKETLGTQSQPNSPSTSSACSGQLAVIQGRQTAMSTAKVKIRNPETKKEIEVTALIDGGCSSTFISENVAKQLELPLQKGQQKLYKVFGTEQPLKIIPHEGIVDLKLKDGSFKSIQVATSSNLLKDFQVGSIPLSKEDREKIRNLKLADQISEKSKKIQIDLQIGNDYFFELLLSGQVKLSSGVTLQETRLGYVIGGVVKTPVQIQAGLQVAGFAWETVKVPQKYKNRNGSQKRTQKFRKGLQVAKQVCLKCIEAETPKSQTWTQPKISGSQLRAPKTWAQVVSSGSQRRAQQPKSVVHPAKALCTPNQEDKEPWKRVRKQTYGTKRFPFENNSEAGKAGNQNFRNSPYSWEGARQAEQKRTWKQLHSQTYPSNLKNT